MHLTHASVHMFVIEDLIFIAVVMTAITGTGAATIYILRRCMGCITSKEDPQRKEKRETAEKKEKRDKKEKKDTKCSSCNLPPHSQYVHYPPNYPSLYPPNYNTYHPQDHAAITSVAKAVAQSIQNIFLDTMLESTQSLSPRSLDSVLRRLPLSERKFFRRDPKTISYIRTR